MVTKLYNFFKLIFLTVSWRRRIIVEALINQDLDHSLDARTEAGFG